MNINIKNTSTVVIRDAEGKAVAQFEMSSIGVEHHPILGSRLVIQKS